VAGARLREPFVAILRQLDLVPEIADVHAHQLGDVALVLHDQDPVFHAKPPAEP
jgi:hypothetical protein